MPRAFRSFNTCQRFQQLGFFRLNKIGKNPHMVSTRETLESDCQTMNAIVNALSAADEGAESSQESLNLSHRSQIPRLPENLRELGKMLAKANLPRALSHNNVYVNDTPSAATPNSPLQKDYRPTFHRSDIFLERSPTGNTVEPRTTETALRSTLATYLAPNDRCPEARQQQQQHTHPTAPSLPFPPSTPADQDSSSAASSPAQPLLDLPKKAFNGSTRPANN